ncbi:MAG: hypothetical protein WD048_00605 [Chitinophagales bacterium]
MPRFPMLPFLLISLLFLSSSCATKEYSQLARTDSAPELNKLFERKHAYIYKSNALLYGEKVSGILAIRQMPDSSYRVILTSYLGLKFFDFGFDGTDFKVHKIMDKMNRPALVEVIKNDFQLLLMSNVDLSQLESFHNPDTGNYVFRHKTGKLTQFYFVNNDGALKRIEQFKKRKKKVVIEIKKYRFKSASEIQLRHLDKKIDIRLGLLK